MFPNVLLHIDGEWCKSADGRSAPVLNPATGEAIGSVSYATRADLDRAIVAAQHGFASWRTDLRAGGRSRHTSARG
jgi:succinate-semialdehyde dehydrogenase/glutarate-semialdehyde dehydrogenase